MLVRYILRFFLVVLNSAILLSCSSSSPTGSETAVIDSTDNTTDTVTTDTSTSGLASVVSGYQGFFLPQSSSSSDVLNIGGQSISLESGGGYIYRYVPEIPALERLDNTFNATNNYSCDNAGTQKPYTTAQLLFNIEVCPDIDDGYSIIDVEQVDASTGALMGNGCNLLLSGSSQVSIEFSVIAGTMYYSDSDGNLITSPTDCDPATTLLAAGDSNNTGRFYGIDGNLVSVKDDVFSNSEYIIRLHDLSSGVISSTLTTISVSDRDDEYRFFEGDDALYWYVYNRDSHVLMIYRYDLSGTPALIFNTALSDSMIGCAVDASAGKVLISYKFVATRTDNQLATSWTVVSQLYDVNSATLATLDLGSNFDSTMQYMVYE